jgi:hypothetical protein
MPAPPNSEKITGATRYRENWRGKLILQVEYYVDEGTYSKSPRADGEAPPRETGWRDASTMDLSPIRYFEMQRNGVKPPPPPPKRED